MPFEFVAAVGPVRAPAITFAAGDVAMALMPLVVGLLSAFVAYSRWRLAPLSTGS